VDVTDVRGGGKEKAGWIAGLVGVGWGLEVPPLASGCPVKPVVKPGDDPGHPDERDREQGRAISDVEYFVSSHLRLLLVLGKLVPPRLLVLNL
jgi:hypothetical protein